MNKDIIVRKNKFLHLSYNPYRKLIPIDRLEELDEYKMSLNNLDDKSKIEFNDSKKFVGIIKNL